MITYQVTLRDDENQTITQTVEAESVWYDVHWLTFNNANQTPHAMFPSHRVLSVVKIGEEATPDVTR